MKPLNPVLRLVVFVGCIFVLFNGGRLSVVRANDCSSYNGGSFSESCPSDCTTSQYTNYSYGGSGIYGIIPVDIPCSPGTCSQPSDAVQAPQQDCSNCCWANGDICYSGGTQECCCYPAQCSIVGNRGICCVPDTQLCNYPNDCCSGVCTDGICGSSCSDLGGPCTTDFDCCQGFCDSFSNTCQDS